jgi:TatD DNase family protein
MLIDSHCHLTDPAFDGDRGSVMGRAKEAGVDRLLVVESVLDRVADTLQWARSVSGVSLATGCHPHEASLWGPEVAALLQAAWQDHLVVGAGEMGLDYHYDHAPRDVQKKCFSEQLAMAVEAGLPAIIHAREADDDVVAILRERPTATVLLHSFSSGPTLLRAGLDDGWYFSFSGMITFRSWSDWDSVTRVPDERLLVETDSPYLAPVPHRGRRNEPSFVTATAARLAELRGTTAERIAELTTANAARIFAGIR